MKGRSIKLSVTLICSGRMLQYWIKKMGREDEREERGKKVCGGSVVHLI